MFADTGVDFDHPDLLENVSPVGYDAAEYSPDGSVTDEFGHGTLVAGIVGAVGGSAELLCWQGKTAKLLVGQLLVP